MRKALLGKDNPADVINVALAAPAGCEPPGYSTLDEMAWNSYGYGEPPLGERRVRERSLTDTPPDRGRGGIPVFSATQDVHDGDVRGGHVDSGIPGIWRRVGGHGGGDLVTVSRRGEQLAAVSVAGLVAGMAVPGTGGR